MAWHWWLCCGGLPTEGIGGGGDVSSLATRTVYISIGNSDDKLTQVEWAEFYGMTDSLVRRWARHVHGAWLSAPDSSYQNACWCIQWLPEDTGLKLTLARYAAEFRQDSIAWAEATTEFIAAATSPDGLGVSASPVEAVA